jgi:pyruvate formate lyase activating enzyme
VSNTLILDNLERLAREHGHLWVRIPVIPGVNDDDEAAAAAAAFLAPLPGIRELHLLPYHPTGESKFARLGRPYRLAGTLVPTVERMHALAGIYAARGLVTRIVGQARGRKP